MSLLFPNNPTEQFISPFISGNDPTNLIGRGLVASGGLGGVPFGVTSAAAGLFPRAFDPYLGGNPLGSFPSGDFNQFLSSLDAQINQTAGLSFGFDSATSPVSFGTYLMGQLGAGSGSSFTTSIPNYNSVLDMSGLSLIGFTPESIGLGGF